MSFLIQNTNDSNYTDQSSTGSASRYEKLPKTFKFGYLVGSGVMKDNDPDLKDPLVKLWKLADGTNVSSLFLKERSRVLSKAVAGGELTLKEQMILNFIFHINPDDPKPFYITDAEWKSILDELCCTYPTLKLSSKLKEYILKLCEEALDQQESFDDLVDYKTDIDESPEDTKAAIKILSNM
jgi:hypothetical protein